MPCTAASLLGFGISPTTSSGPLKPWPKPPGQQLNRRVGRLIRGVVRGVTGAEPQRGCRSGRSPASRAPETIRPMLHGLRLYELAPSASHMPPSPGIFVLRSRLAPLGGAARAPGGSVRATRAPASVSSAGQEGSVTRASPAARRSRAESATPVEEVDARPAASRAARSRPCSPPNRTARPARIHRVYDGLAWILGTSARA